MFAAFIGGLCVLFAIAAVVLAVAKKAAAWLLIAVVLLFLGGAAFMENPWWVLLSIALAGAGLLLLVSRVYAGGVIAATVALVVYLQGRFNLFDFVANLPWWAYVGIGFVAAGITLLLRRSVGAGVAAIALAALVFVGGSINFFGMIGNAFSSTATAQMGGEDKPINGTGTPAPGDCPTKFVQKFDPNERGSFASNGVKNIDEILTLAGTDARYLAFFASRPEIKLWPDTKPEPLLIPGNACLSQEGQAIWNQVYGALKNPAVTVEDGQAPANHFNSGMANGQPVVDSQPGIGGDRSAVVITTKNGDKLYVLKRCANITSESQSDLPRGETDHQRPPGHTTVVTTPPTTTPPPPDDDKIYTEAPGQGGAGDGGSSMYGGDGSDRHTATGGPSAPAAGDPQPGSGQQDPPADNPVPGGQPAPGGQPSQPPATGAPPTDDPDEGCVNPPGQNICG